MGKTEMEEMCMEKIKINLNSPSFYSLWLSAARKISRFSLLCKENDGKLIPKAKWKGCIALSPSCSRWTLRRSAYWLHENVTSSILLSCNWSAASLLHNHFTTQIATSSQSIACCLYHWLTHKYHIHSRTPFCNNLPGNKIKKKRKNFNSK